MRHDGTNEGGRDQDWPTEVHWDLGAASGHVGEILWRCDALRAGQLYNRSLFGSRKEAERFAMNMREAEPDQMFKVESVLASTVWN